MAFTLVNYSQQDPAWKSVKIGKSSETIGHVGCALTSLAMLVSGHGYPETPKTLNGRGAAAKLGMDMERFVTW